MDLRTSVLLAGMMTKPEIIPPEPYEKVDYIEGFGQQYIDTGVSAPNGFVIKTKFSISTSSGTWRCICGCHEPTAPHKRNFIMTNYNERVSSNTILSCGQGNGDKWCNDILLLLNTKYTIEASNIYNNTYIKINGTNATLRPQDSPSNSYSSRNLYLFADNNGSSLSNPAQFFIGKMYATQIFVGDVIVRDYIPVLNTQTGKYGMFDTISGQFFGNSGSGDFGGGND